jgi:hypothetical protein
MQEHARFLPRMTLRLIRPLLQTSRHLRCGLSIVYAAIVFVLSDIGSSIPREDVRIFD